MAAKKTTGRSADAMAGAAAAKKAAAKAKATGQTASSAMDAGSRRYKTTAKVEMVQRQGFGIGNLKNKKDPVVTYTTKDRVTGKSTTKRKSF